MGGVGGGPTDYLVTLNLSWGWVEAVTTNTQKMELIWSIFRACETHTKKERKKTSTILYVYRFYVFLMVKYDIQKYKVNCCKSIHNLCIVTKIELTM